MRISPRVSKGEGISEEERGKERDEVVDGKERSQGVGF